jgi:hypothetical protein
LKNNNVAINKKKVLVRRMPYPCPEKAKGLAIQEKQTQPRCGLLQSRNMEKLSAIEKELHILKTNMIAKYGRKSLLEVTTLNFDQSLFWGEGHLTPEERLNYWKNLESILFERFSFMVSPDHYERAPEA